MKRLSSIFSAALLTFSATCDTEIYVNLHDLTWVGSGTEFYSVWSVAAPADRTDFGAWMHLDASYATSISNQPANGTNFVYQWSDWRANGVYARQHSYWLWMPHTASAVQNGKAVVRFPFSDGDNRPTLAFVETRSDIFAVFSVLKSDPAASYPAYIGGDSTYDFIGGETGGFLYNGTYASTRILNGTNAVDGVLTSATLIQPTGAYHVVSMRTSGGGVRGDSLARDRSYRAGGIDFAELLIFTNPVSDAVTTEIEAYLKAKWATP